MVLFAVTAQKFTVSLYLQSLLSCRAVYDFTCPTDTSAPLEEAIEAPENSFLSPSKKHISEG